MNKSMSLFLLQNIDLKMDQHHTRLQQIDRSISDHSVEDQINQTIQSIAGELKVSNDHLADIEKKINTTRIKLQQSESSLYGGKIHNPKELQDLEAEIKLLKASLQQLEEKQFDQMLVSEQFQKDQLECEHRLSVAGEEHANLAQILTVEADEIHRQLDRIQKERDALTVPIDKDTLDVYNRLRKTKAGIPVTQVEENTCDKCGAEITQLVWQKARITNDLYFCGTCGRIIYAK
jgi:uncharacterized protein